MMFRNPALHKAPLGYAKDGPLTWVAECRVPRVPPDRTRLAIAKWMIENGSDVHQRGDAPLMRAALNSERILMMELLVAHGADVNAAWHGNYAHSLCRLRDTQPHYTALAIRAWRRSQLWERGDMEVTTHPSPRYGARLFAGCLRSRSRSDGHLH